jgi:hypothetical protein
MHVLTLYETTTYMHSHPINFFSHIQTILPKAKAGLMAVVVKNEVKARVQGDGGFLASVTDKVSELHI